MDAQLRRHSALETLIHIAAGFIVTVGILFLFFPDIGIVPNLLATVVMTVIKFIVHYHIRRYFAVKMRNKLNKDLTSDS